jgi:predicted transcriptional regulator
MATCAKRNVRIGFDAEGDTWWDRLAWDGMSNAAQLILQGAIEANMRQRRAMAIIEAEGETTTDNYKNTKAHPAIAIEAQSRTAVRMALKTLEDMRNKTGEKKKSAFTKFNSR